MQFTEYYKKMQCVGYWQERWAGFFTVEMSVVQLLDRNNVKCRLKSLSWLLTSHRIPKNCVCRAFNLLFWPLPGHMSLNIPAGEAAVLQYKTDLGAWGVLINSHCVVRPCLPCLLSSRIEVPVYSGDNEPFIEDLPNFSARLLSALSSPSSSS